MFVTFISYLESWETSSFLHIIIIIFVVVIIIIVVVVVVIITTALRGLIKLVKELWNYL